MYVIDREVKFMSLLEIIHLFITTKNLLLRAMLSLAKYAKLFPYRVQYYRLFDEQQPRFQLTVNPVVGFLHYFA